VTGPKVVALSTSIDARSRHTACARDTFVRPANAFAADQAVQILSCHMGTVAG
jgi:hypothetical protein